MSLEQGFTIIDALNLAVEKLQSQGMPEQEAYIALLVRLWGLSLKKWLRLPICCGMTLICCQL